MAMHEYVPMEPDKSIHPFSRILKDLRIKKGYTQEKLAEAAGVSRRVIDHYESSAQRPNIEKVKKLAAALGVSDEELIGIDPISKKDDYVELSYKDMKKFRLLESFSVRERQAVYNLINSIAEKHKLKKKAKDEDED